MSDRAVVVALTGAAALIACLIGLPSAQAVESSPASPSVSSRPRVLIIGDSTTVHMVPTFRVELAAHGLDATIDARIGRTTRQGRGVLAGYDEASFDYTVVLLGANGRRGNALRDMKALKALGADTAATVQAPRQATVNRAIAAVFGSDRISWAGYAKRHGVHTTDGKHYSTAGYRARADYLAREISERVR